MTTSIGTETDRGRLADSMKRVMAILNAIPDPEIPVISICELGIVRDVQLHYNDNDKADHVEVTLTPTYSGCPAIGQIEDDVRRAMASLGFNVTLRTQLSPAWTTDWMGPEAREKLRAYGIAPPHSTPSNQRWADGKVIQFATKKVANNVNLTGTSGPSITETSVNCPQCGSANTTETSHFGSTACKALYRCLDCMEPFDYFKPY